ncbi:protein of unknown function [Alcaligenes faecalis subsp. faecalis]|nr:protein of unknown function [Alcaligenes faecalis subsp. faecalis]
MVPDSGLSGNCGDWCALCSRNPPQRHQSLASSGIKTPCACHFPPPVKQMQGSVNGGATQEDLRVQSNIASGFNARPFSSVYLSSYPCGLRIYASIASPPTGYVPPKSWKKLFPNTASPLVPARNR